jgi:hypothetical protein
MADKNTAGIGKIAILGVAQSIWVGAAYVGVYVVEEVNHIASNGVPVTGKCTANKGDVCVSLPGSVTQWDSRQ